MLDGQMNLDTLARLQRRGRVDDRRARIARRQLDLDVTVLAQVRDPCHGAAQGIAGAAPSLTAEGRMQQAAPPAPAWLRSSPCRTLSPTRKAPVRKRPCSSLLVPMNEATNVLAGREEHIDGAVERAPARTARRRSYRR